MKFDFSSASLTDKSWLIFGWAKGWILFHTDVFVTKRKQQGGDSRIIWARIVDKTIEPFKVDEGVKLNSASNAILWRWLSLHGTSPSSAVSKWSVYLCRTMLILMYLSFSMKSLSMKNYQTEDKGIASIKFLSKSNRKSKVISEDESIWKLQTI